MILLADGTRLLAAAMHEGKEHLWGNTFAHLDSIAAGILLALWLGGKSLSLRRSQRIALILFGLLCFGIRGHYRIIPGGDELSILGTLVGYNALVAGAIAIMVAFIGMPLRSATLQYLGKISYGLYVYHLGCILVMDKFFIMDPGVLHAALRVFVAFAFTVAVSAVSYAIIEKPFLNLKRRFTFIESRPV
jgi:peptidoglycan/LPS O-acetylase OafA/YrhL